MAYIQIDQEYYSGSSGTISEATCEHELPDNLSYSCITIGSYVCDSQFLSFEFETFESVSDCLSSSFGVGCGAATPSQCGAVAETQRSRSMPDQVLGGRHARRRSIVELVRGDLRGACEFASRALALYTAQAHMRTRGYTVAATPTRS